MCCQNAGTAIAQVLAQKFVKQVDAMFIEVGIGFIKQPETAM